MKIICSNSVMSIIFKVLFFLPLLLIIKIIEDIDFALFYAILIIFFQSVILFLFNMAYGFIVLKNDKLFVSSDFQIKSIRVQDGFCVLIKDIVAIEYTKEENMNKNYIGSAPYLKLYLGDGTVKKIHLIKFSFRTWKKIEKCLLDINKNILVMRDAASLKKYLKTGLWE